MASHFSEKDLETIVQLKEVEGLTHKQIAERMGRLDKDGAPNERSIMVQYKKAKGAGMQPPIKEEPLLPALKEPAKQMVIAEEPTVATPDLNELTRKQRVDYIKSRLPSSARGKHIFNSVLSADEQDLFLEEYFSVLREEDSITAAEEQQLFNATLHLILAWRAAAQDKGCYDHSPLSGYKGQDSTIYVDTFKKDYQENMKKYNEFMKSLKLSREQRLKDLQRQGTTFLDFAEKYAKNDEQVKAADELMRIEKYSEAELKRLQANGWLIAGGLLANKDCNFGPDKTIVAETPNEN